MASTAIEIDADMAASSPPTRTAPLPEWQREALGKLAHGTYARAFSARNWDVESNRCRTWWRDVGESLWLNGFNAGCATAPVASDAADYDTAGHYMADVMTLMDYSMNDEQRARLVEAARQIAQVPVEEPAPARLGDTTEEEQAADESASAIMGTTPAKAAIAAVRRASGAVNPPVLARGFLRWHRTAASEIAGLLANLALMAKPPEQASRPTAEMAVELGELGCAGTEAA